MIEKFNPKGSQVITFSDNAIEHFKNYLKLQSGIAIRISVQKRGCSGLAYHVESVSHKLNNHFKITKKLVTFFIDAKVLLFLSGLHIDYIKKPLGLSQLVYHNPNELTRCGCGESFVFNNLDTSQ